MLNNKDREYYGSVRSAISMSEIGHIPLSEASIRA